LIGRNHVQRFLQHRKIAEFPRGMREMTEEKKLPWFCGGNLPNPFSSLEVLEAFVADTREHAHRLIGMEKYVQEADERIWYLKAVRDGRLVPPTIDMSRRELEAVIEQHRPFAASNIAAREKIESARYFLDDMGLG